MTGLIVLASITAYLAGMVWSAPKLMRLIYQDKLAVVAQANARYERHMEDWRKNKDASALTIPMRYGDDELAAMRDARVEGAWWSLVWPVALTFYRVAGTAFAQEIAAQQAGINARIIKDYDRLLEERFDQELASANPRTGIIRRLTTRKEHS